MPDNSERSRTLTCHRCRSAALILIEATVVTTFYDGGLYLNGGGEITAIGSGYHDAGGTKPEWTEIECQGCGHCWRPRRRFAGDDSNA